LLLQPLSSIQVRTEALLLTKLEVWWYLVVKLGANLPAHFEQVLLVFLLVFYVHVYTAHFEQVLLVFLLLFYVHVYTAHFEQVQQAFHLYTRIT
jgi:hypothetical protein